MRVLLRPVGYVTFMGALLAFWLTAWLLGEDDDLGVFSERFTRMVWHYPEVTRRAVEAAWLTWAVLFAIALSPFSPVRGWWDEVALATVGLFALWRQRLYGRGVGR
jgi:hypothetical protein